MLYFNSETQLTQMVARILGGVNIPLVRHTIKISVLGCKGGIGASFISSHIAQTIAAEKKVPVLLAQGSNGSQDLDLLFDKKYKVILPNIRKIWTYSVAYRLVSLAKCYKI
ncbi:Flp pilus assembly protein, ATPase [Actinobacillus equuli]|nr:Flp pilus assembly protein, ATPase [Actinobacillus equuli]